ncbi:hypothetical protein HMI54_013806 [Coelomomyces lativittatus]|nr:hypothetical protein HMI54_013806 [Coelomomyces lativittatus]
MNIKIFGQLTDITGTGSVTLDDVADTDTLIQKLQLKYPGLSQAKYAIAVNKQIIQHTTALQQDAEIALLPPFSGG